MATITNLNETVLTQTADNLVLAGELPLLHKELTITNPQSVAVTRGMAVINSSGTLYVAGAKSGSTTISGDIVGIVAEDMAIDGTSATLNVDCYVFGAFNAAEVTSINSLDISTAAYVLGAQGNGIYLV